MKNNYQTVGEVKDLEIIPIIEKGLLQKLNKLPSSYVITDDVKKVALNITESFNRKIQVHFIDSNIENMASSAAVLSHNADVSTPQGPFCFEGMPYVYRLAVCQQYDCSITYDELVREAVKVFMDAAEAEEKLSSFCKSNICIHQKDFEKHQKRFIHNIYIDEPFSEFKSLDEAIHLVNKESHLLFKASTGTGKTELVIKPQIEQAINAGQRVILITHRKSILDAINIEGLADYRDIQFDDDIGSLKICINSLYKPTFHNVAKKADLIVIDEVQQVINQMLTGDMNGKRTEVFNALSNVVKKAPRLIACDADANDACSRYLKAKPVVINTDTYNGIQVELRNQTNLFSEVVKEAKDHQIIFTTDSKRHADAMSEKLKATYPGKRIMLITGKTVADDEQREFISNINEHINKYDIVIYTPAMSAGVSIHESNGSRKNYGYFVGCVVPSDLIQMMRRDRTARHFSIGLSAVVHTRMPSRSPRDNSMEIQIDNLNNHTYFIKKAFKPAFVFTLRHLGFNVILNDQEEATEDTCKTISDAMLLEEEAYIDGILSANPASDEEAKVADLEEMDQSTFFSLERREVELLFKTKELTETHVKDWNRGKLKKFVDLNRILLRSDSATLKKQMDVKNRGKASNEMDLSFEKFTLLNAMLQAAGIDIKARTANVTHKSATDALNIAMSGSNKELNFTWNNLGFRPITRRNMQSKYKVRTLNNVLKSVLGYGLVGKNKMKNGKRSYIYEIDSDCAMVQNLC
ncbi:DEAD/DEAH box helicase family protein [Neptuniibacter sp.]|uniref:DEAD/DEAH box helicase family protein n=1 Tax=Neptuniibacter sp. TaxID=1962643 RepID=UPI003B5D0461